MTKDSMKPKSMQGSKRGDVLADEIGEVYRQLAAEHVELRATASVSRSVSDAAVWERIEAKTAHNQGMRGARLAASHRRSSVAHSTRLWMAAAVCLAAFGGAWALPGEWKPWARQGSDEAGRVSFEVDGSTIGPDVAGRGHLVASESVPVDVRLSDRSQINLQPHTTIRLAALSDGVVITRMSQGAVDVDVVHQAHTNYQFFAGPYLVKVVGTAFRLSYEPQSEALDLKMRSGVVEVLGPDGGSRTVKGGQSLHLQGVEPVSRVQDAVPTPTKGEPGRLTGSEPAAASAIPDATGPASYAPAHAGTDFRQLAAQGDFAEIVRLAQLRGVDSLLASAPADQLQELAQAARYSGQLDLAERVWVRMSSRFSGQVLGKSAVFFIGRLEEQRGRYGAALARYESYLRTNPQGVYAQEAWGRKLQLSQKSQDLGATRHVAQQYLQRYPGGPYAATARSIVARTR